MTVADRWWDRAACLGSDPDWFFPNEDYRNQDIPWKEAQAKAVCQGCSVRAQCLADAIRYDAEGIWGGTNKTERRAMVTE